MREAHDLTYRLLELLDDVWMQFSIEAVVNGERVRNDGGLSVLEDVFRVLMEADRIHANGELRAAHDARRKGE